MTTIGDFDGNGLPDIAQFVAHTDFTTTVSFNPIGSTGTWTTPTPASRRAWRAS